jgi:hypothetical protein
MNPKNLLQFQEASPTWIKISQLKNILISIILISSLFSCKEKIEDPITEESGNITFHFTHLINGENILFDTLIYTNEADNPYLINEIQYFISDVKLYYKNGNVKLLDDWKDIHYIDTDLPETHTWQVFDDIVADTYDSISFTFGISEEKNISFMYVNPPERDMFWPEYLGGGYHYMKLNGKWLEEGQTIQTTPFDFHMGIGQIYNSQDSIIGFVQNYFEVSLASSGFSISNGQQKDINLIMNVENWFKEPHIYNHDIWGGYIMQNQEAMQIAKDNGSNVFSIDFP